MTTRSAKAGRPGRGRLFVHGVSEGRWLDIPREAFTHAGFRAWACSDDFPEEGRISFLQGDVYVDMAAERLESHVKVKTEVTRVLGNVVVEEDLGGFFGDGTGLSNEDAEVAHVPDGTFVSWKSFEAGRVRQVPSPTGDGDFTELEGAPDMVLEVVSPSSVEKDTRLLRELYHRAGIAEYWLIDARGDEVQFQILCHRPKGYASAPQKGGWQRSRVFGRSFRLERTRDRLGDWRYRLLIQGT
jgi:Uma2 family endonuclease